MREEDLSYFDEPEFKRALDKYLKAKEAGSSVYMDADELVDIAEYYMTQGQEVEANQAVDLALQLHPDSVDPQIFLARQQLFWGNTEQARTICSGIMDQNDREVHFLRAEIMIREDHAQQASDYLMGVFDTLSEDRGLFLYDSTQIFMDYNQFEIAKQWVDTLMENYPEWKKGKKLYPEVLICLGNYPEAIPLLKQLLEEDPYDVYCWNLLAESHGATENYQEAIDCCEFVLAIENDNSRATIMKAHSLFHLNQLDECHEIYKKYLQQHPDDDVVYYMDAVCLCNLDRFEEAREDLIKADEISQGLSQEQIHIYLQLAYVESKLHHLDEAIVALDNAKELANDEVVFEYDLLLGQMYLENGQSELASDHFLRATENSDNKASTLLSIAVAYGEVMMYTESITILLSMLRLFGEEQKEQVYPYMAYCYFNLHDQVNYLHYLKEAARLNHETTEFLFSSYFPGVVPEEYYMYAFKSVYGRFPEDWE